MVLDADLEAQLRQLLDKNAIREALVKMHRGTDRLDEDLVKAAFHEDAVYEHWAVGVFVGAESIARSLMNILKQERFIWATHFLMQSATELEGDVAFSEDHCLSCSVRKIPGPDPTFFARAFRLLHRWERRDGKTWKIAYRTALVDGFEFGGPFPETGLPLTSYGKRNPRDVTYHWHEAMQQGEPYAWE